MTLSSSAIPEHLLKLVPKATRATLGKAGMLASEIREVVVAKSERELQSQLQNLLPLNGVKFVIRQRMDKRSNVRSGCPDILFALNGEAHAWEVKMPGEKPREDQVKAMAEMTADGWKCAVVTSVDHALSILKEARTITE